MFHLAIVAADHFAHTGGVAAAANVFEQERVIEGGSFRLIEGEMIGEAHAIQTAADGVAGYRAFGEIERKGER